MGSGEKKIVAVLVVVLVGLVFVYLRSEPKAGPLPAIAPGAGGDSASCAPSGSSGAGVPTQEFGKKGAKLEIVAALPITHHCHVDTEAELKKAYEKHKDEIHLTIYDLFGPEGQEYVASHGGQRAVVFIDGKSVFEFKGQRVVLEKQENISYQPSQLLPIIEQELRNKG